jgi:hypothetical protein
MNGGWMDGWWTDGITQQQSGTRNVTSKGMCLLDAQRSPHIFLNTSMDGKQISPNADQVKFHLRHANLFFHMHLIN